MTIKAIVFNAQDNTAVALMDLEKGTVLDLPVGGQTKHVTLIEPIAYQHKFAVEPIKKGQQVLKYGQAIGEATRDIEAGEHVHIHNMVGLRLKAASIT